ncbi:MAG: four helix bundle protein, partial [Thermodesulfovibrionales bacterium]|nr:four helix bundle protein [Thermodesulfovibrionales bacterium]
MKVGKYVLCIKDKYLTPWDTQPRRASVSIMSNIAEGFERAGRAEFHQFLVIAKGSAAEVRSQLYVALDAEYINQDKFNQLKEIAEE